MSTTTLISERDLKKVNEIVRLHDEAFWHLYQFDTHSKSGDGFLSVKINFGTVWDRENGATHPNIEVSLYSYVVATDGERSHDFESIDEALAAVTEWHSKAMSYNPTDEDLARMDKFAAEMWDAVKDKVIVIDASNDGE